MSNEYPSIIDHLTRTPPQIDWTEYAAYIADTTDYTTQQAHIISGVAHNLTNTEIADHLDTSTETIATQRQRITYDNLTDRKETELLGGIPGCALRHVGEAHIWSTAPIEQKATTNLQKQLLERRNGAMTANAYIQVTKVGENTQPRVYLLVNHQHPIEDANTEFDAVRHITEKYVYNSPEHFRNNSLYATLTDDAYSPNGIIVDDGYQLLSNPEM